MNFKQDVAYKGGEDSERPMTFISISQLILQP